MQENKVLAVILARGGSKAIPKKNIADLNGHPLIAYTIVEALKSKNIVPVGFSPKSRAEQNLPSYR